jgi:hypothetical protein
MQAAPAKVGVSRIASRQTINFVVAPTPSVHTDPAALLALAQAAPGQFGMVPLQGCRLAQGTAIWAAASNGRSDHGQRGAIDYEHNG